MVDLDSRHFITNDGRVCNLKSTSEERYVNTYNPILLKFSQANMDIQPCGSNETITHCIEKSRPACVTVPYITPANDTANYYYSLLLHYVPNRSENEYLDGFNRAREAFQAQEELLRKQCEMMEIHRERDQAMNVLQREIFFNITCYVQEQLNGS
ncbi:ATP-dependent DNA helicase [Nephila pilipes]|uniref:ATP-dependent DNA helicase n=1 Tax=Nephila pilipes TaxID=299642 RepID=A0A8X6M8W5_NEPPI|nr:ATP-dependent DNA helicase [Nephila pilipes]